MKFGIIYKATSPSGKVYIGQTILSLNVRKNKHLSCSFNKNSNSYNNRISYAVRKYGKENIKWEILYNNVPNNYLNYMEVSVISWYNSYFSGYNSTMGGTGTVGYRHSKATRTKISNALKGKILSEDNKKKLLEGGKAYWTAENRKALSEKVSGAGHPMYGKTHTKSARARISANNKGKLAGTKSPNAKLTWKKVREIRSKYIPQKYSTRKLAEEYNVSQSVVQKVISGLTWKE